MDSDIPAPRKPAPREPATPDPIDDFLAGPPPAANLLPAGPTAKSGRGGTTSEPVVPFTDTTEPVDAGEGDPLEPTSVIDFLAASASGAEESAHDRHTREFIESATHLEENVESSLERFLGRAVPVVVALVAAGIAMYALGNWSRDRADRRRIARAQRRAARRAITRSTTG